MHLEMNSGQKQEQVEQKDCSIKAISKAFGFEHPEEMLLWLPIRYIDLSSFDNPTNIDGLRHLFKLKLLSKRLDISQKPRKLKLSFDCDGSSVYANVIGPEIEDWSKVPTGEFVCFEGISTALGDNFFIKGIELVREDLGAIIPVYKGKHKYKPHEIRNAIRELSFNTLDHVAMKIYAKTFGEDARVDSKWMAAIKRIIRASHFPSTMSDGEFGLKKIKDLCIRYLLEKAEQTTVDNGAYSSVKVDAARVAQLKSRLKFSLTTCQEKGVVEISNGLQAEKRMLRLVNGDVGTGKTETYLLPCVAAAMGGASLGIMVPNDILARGIVERIRGIEPHAKVKLVTGNGDDGLYHGYILVGTSALVHRSKKYSLNFDILVIDEEQKFSVEQKSVLVQDKTNVIYATATCIPRTGALLQYGNVEVTILKTCPVEKKIHSRIIGQLDYFKMINYLKRFTNEGKQVGVVFVKLAKEAKPKKGEEASNEPKKQRGKRGKSLEEHVGAFQNEFGDDVTVLHGKLKDTEKDYVIQSMIQGKYKVLICSNIIETGITLPDLFSLTVFDADYLGISQLHQLRGRLARLGGVGEFNMVPSENCSELGLAKLQVIKDNLDGFVVAEKDLEIRGFGDLSYDSQSQTGESNGLFFCLPIMPNNVAEYMASR